MQLTRFSEFDFFSTLEGILETLKLLQRFMLIPQLFNQKPVKITILYMFLWFLIIKYRYSILLPAKEFSDAWLNLRSPYFQNFLNWNLFFKTIYYTFGKMHRVRNEFIKIYVIFSNLIVFHGVQFIKFFVRNFFKIIIKIFRATIAFVLRDKFFAQTSHINDKEKHVFVILRNWRWHSGRLLKLSVK